MIAETIPRGVDEAAFHFQEEFALEFEVTPRRRFPSPPPKKKVVLGPKRISPRGTHRESRIAGFRAMLDQFAYNEATLEEGFFKLGNIPRDQYLAATAKIEVAWEELGDTLIREFRNEQSVRQRDAVRQIEVDRGVYCPERALGGTPFGLNRWLNRIHATIQEAVEEVFGYVSTGLARRIGPVRKITVVAQDAKVLAGGIVVYRGGDRRELYISGAVLGTYQSIRLAVGWGTMLHLVKNAPTVLRRRLSDDFRRRVKMDWEMETKAYGESAPYFTSRDFWEPYQGVVPLITHSGGIQELDLDQGGLHMATVAFVTLVAGDRRLLGRVLRDARHRATFFDGLTLFATSLGKNGKVRLPSDMAS